MQHIQEENVDFNQVLLSHTQFYRLFKQQGAEVQSLLQRCKEGEEATKSLATAKTALDAMNGLFLTHVAQLPAYDQQNYQKTIDQLRATINNLSASVVPAKKFSFRSRNAAARPQPTTKKVEVQSANKSAEESNHNYLVIRDSIGSVKVYSQETEFLNKHVTVSDCTNAQVYIGGVVGALTCTNLVKCVICCGPTNGSVFIDSCTTCTFYFASKQLRIHNSKDCEFSVNTKSKPIIEGCSKELEEMGFKRNEENFEKEFDVQDFGWVKSTPSPNWSYRATINPVHLNDLITH